MLKKTSDLKSSLAETFESNKNNSPFAFMQDIDPEDQQIILTYKVDDKHLKATVFQLLMQADLLSGTHAFGKNSVVVDLKKVNESNRELLIKIIEGDKKLLPPSSSPAVKDGEAARSGRSK